MTAFLIDEMFPPAVAAVLREKYQRDAVHVADVGLRAAPDPQVAAVARAEGWAIVTGNVVDYAPERDVVLVFVLKRKLPAGRAQGPALATLLDGWARDNPDPYIGAHWPVGSGLSRPAFDERCYGGHRNARTSARFVRVITSV